jgi:antitoxin (DNA-binding transcriptional repressor) of toxin-antitoxin stability system
MESEINATDAIRDFSAILNRIAYGGETFLIHRNGKPTARLLPFEQSPLAGSLGQLKSLLGQLPPLGEEAGAFRRDIEESIGNQPMAPETAKWA